MRTHNRPLSSTVAVCLLAASPLPAWQSEAVVGKSGTLSFSSDVRVGETLLKPGQYFIYLKSLKRGPQIRREVLSARGRGEVMSIRRGAEPGGNLFRPSGGRP
jgi:hypothetical protein